MTASSTRKFPVTVVAVRTEQNEAEVMLNAVGAEIFAHGYKPIKDIAPLICRERSLLFSVNFFLKPKKSKFCNR